MKTYSYAAVFEPTEREGGFTVTFPDVPEAITEGEGMADARAMAEDALGVALLTYLEMGRALPEPIAEGYMIAPAPEIAMKIAVIETFRASGLSRTELARRIGKDEKEARRLLDPDTATKLPLMNSALAAMGQRLVIGLEAAE
ncbi:type II toxin-antitoxin system HicB family antitoxin [Rhizobium sp. LC145]|uniref:type II toxin-antitoxin system HicB family antitoxin n=1 Tax=Rhizobium sp. LC145 TaxID=1120688 RepID=UPI00062A2D74|nr:type II toxin-antitoxin system HicB family antitoxin [Rhizobium sp. LC145]KKX24348.1 transcriptional regulator [Rhizobium sp. LC145]TKT46143.1 type II toxin-antitoxin system HicB family antitoxin [Rhizobiaceae bacterium LC148]